MNGEWYVSHGGDLAGLGLWSGPHPTRAEAEESAERCRREAGGQPEVWFKPTFFEEVG